MEKERGQSWLKGVKGEGVGSRIRGMGWGQRNIGDKSWMFVGDLRKLKEQVVIMYLLEGNWWSSLEGN